ncbi:MAG: ATP-binding protein [Desulfococcaceae bacterium]|nr:ATP-binding protein [Desulfococcaceae bacterium]
MKNRLRKLPIDHSSFEIIREEDMLYVDKTFYIHEMLEEGRYFFMARPRRFGKSLMVSALKCFFGNRKELFDGLWIAENGDWEWAEYPVISFDFNEIGHDTAESFGTDLERNLLLTAQQYDLSLAEPSLKGKFRELVLALREKTGKPAVILIDEYDKPIIDHLGKGTEGMETAKANRDILKYFLGTMKGGDTVPHIRFVFITGVSKFSRVSIFSDLNNLIDISMNRKYAAMLGYTQEEVENCFPEYIRELAEESGLSQSHTLAELRRYYDGYRFSKKKICVYNPFSVLRAFSNLELNNYWFETGTPSFLINLLRERDYNLPSIENLTVSEQIFSVYELERLNPEALLFQTGYLTIHDVRGRIFQIGYPNREVKLSFLESLFYSFAPEDSYSEISRFLLLAEYLEAEDYNSFFETVNAIFASLSYTLQTEKNEAYFHTLFYLMVSASGSRVQSEVITSRGRIDLTVEFADKIFIMEFKCGHSADAALKQIHDKGYAEMYAQKGKKRILMGIDFDSQKRNVAEWKTETL